MTKTPRGYTKCLDLLNCGNELIAFKGTEGKRDYVAASARKLGNVFVLTIGTSTSRTTDEALFMEDLSDFKGFTSWLAKEPDTVDNFVRREVQTMSLEAVAGKPSKARRRKQ